MNSKIQLKKDNNSEKWYNQDGLLLHTGYGRILSDEYLLVYNGKLYGVIDYLGNKIIGYLYDRIVMFNDGFIVVNDNKIGIVNMNGQTVLFPIYKSIECNIIETNENEVVESIDNNRGYSRKLPFDTLDMEANANINKNEETDLTRAIAYISDNKEWSDHFRIDDGNLHMYAIGLFRIDSSFVVDDGNIKSICTEKDGILSNSFFEDIYQVTKNLYVVKKNGKYGVYNQMKDSITNIDTNYDRIRYMGGSVFLLCKNGKWGAETSYCDLFIWDEVSIETIYDEIEVIESDFSRFSVKDYDWYTVIDQSGKEIGGFYKDSYPTDDYYSSAIDIYSPIYIRYSLEIKPEEHIKLFDEGHYLVKNNGLYGLMNTDGSVLIPFVYERMMKRKDGNIDVYSNGWGIITINGYTVVPCRYKNRFNEIWKGGFVRCSKSGYFGYMDENYKEIIPPVHEQLKIYPTTDNNILYFLCGHDCSCYDGFVGGKWGYIDKNGKQIVPSKYVFFEHLDSFILAGRQYKPYIGPYDLYSSDGEFLIGNIMKFVYDKQSESYAFFFGGEWIVKYEETEFYDDDGYYIGRLSRDPMIESITFDSEGGKWLLLDKDFNSIIKDSEGKQLQVNKGFIACFNPNEKYNVSSSYNLPESHMVEEFFGFYDGNVIVNDLYGEPRGYEAINIETGKIFSFDIDKLQTVIVDNPIYDNEEIRWTELKSKIEMDKARRKEEEREEERNKEMERRKREENEYDERDTWYAMTDGAYGDMPEGFDGDYDFMGY